MSITIIVYIYTPLVDTKWVLRGFTPAFHWYVVQFIASYM